MQPRPVIGVSLDAEPAGGFAATPWYALRQNYLDSLATAGMTPLALPHYPDCVEHYLALCDGIVITGGAFDIDPALFGEDIRSSKVKLKPERTRFEQALATGAMARSMPLLGICGGEQLLAALGGGRLVQHIPDDFGADARHESEAPGRPRHHAIAITPDTLLHRITGTTTRQVNSSHHQAVRSVGPGWQINAQAPDGVIEGIESRHHPFCLGVQWHPEYLEQPGDAAIFEALKDAAAGWQRRQK